METAVGIFTTRSGAETAARQLRSRDVPLDRIQLLLPETADADISALPIDEAEAPGVGKAVGGVVGGAVGATAGLGIGAAAASLLIPGVGAVTAIGLAAAALLGAGGVIGGAKAGEAFEEKTEHGLPKDEVYLYRDALARGHSILFVMADTEEEAAQARKILEAAGAESLDAAREKWWIGIREPEREHYEETGGHFEDDEVHYRRGFVSALHPDSLGKPYVRMPSELRRRYPDSYGTEPFRHGYERGLQHAAGAPVHDEAMAERR
ncbi:MAG TPA: hypothetical protein VJA66_17080 [Thermoanaerobaculia bacterium]